MARVLALCALAAAVAAPAAFSADPVPADYKNAAKYCKAVRESKGVEGFQTAYGTNKNKKNAYGKCVSQTAKAKAAKREDAKKGRRRGRVEGDRRLQEAAGRRRREVREGLQELRPVCEGREGRHGRDD